MRNITDNEDGFQVPLGGFRGSTIRSKEFTKPGFIFPLGKRSKRVIAMFYTSYELKVNNFY